MSKTCWVVCDQGKVGTANQCIGLAEGLGFSKPIVKFIKARPPWSYLPARFWFCPLQGLEPHHHLSPPWPDLIVAAGRASVAPTAHIRRVTQGRTKVIQLQNPRLNPDDFDAVIAPRHDNLSGKTVIETQGALHRVTKSRLEEEYKAFQDSLASLPRPITTVLLGGTNSCYQLRRPQILEIIQNLQKVLDQTRGSLAVTVSRRTDPALKALLKKGLAGLPHVLWEGEGANPYFAFLQAADYLIVTSDSVSMTSEACFTGKPVYTYVLPGESRKFRQFHDFFQRQGYTRPFRGSIESWTYSPLDEMPLVLQKLSQLCWEGDGI